MYLESDSTEDEMIANIEEFIKKYVEQVLDAAYLRKLTLNTSSDKNKPCKEKVIDCNYFRFVLAWSQGDIKIST